MLEVVEKDLFGNEAGTDWPAEFFTLSHIMDHQREMVSRATWCFENLPTYDWAMLDIEDAVLLSDALLAYVFGLFGVVIVATDGFCERLLTDAIEARGDTGSARRGLGAVIASAEKMELLEPFILRRISRLHAIRNNLCHEKGPDNPMRLFRRSLASGQHHEMLLKIDAREGLCIARGLARQVKRSFPRLDLPGKSYLQEELL